jgi:hypothetical protein
MARRFRVKEVIRQDIASVTRVRMTNEDADREGAAEWKSEVKFSTWKIGHHLGHPCQNAIECQVSSATGRFIETSPPIAILNDAIFDKIFTR